MFVINPDPYSLPTYRIGPFQTRDLSINHSLPENNIIDEYFNERFTDKDYLYTENGRQAIHIALCFYKLQKDDVVTILTTSGNFYISGCVTKEIEKFCKWSRVVVPETKLIFVNHEFGYPYKDLGRLRDYKIPIIEDCASSFFSQDSKNEIGQVGDFVIYSFPKMFPLQIGGLLVCPYTGRIKKELIIKSELHRHIKNVLSNYILDKEEIIKKRFFNYEYLKTKFMSLGFTERFKLEKGAIPGVFMFRPENKKVDLNELKKYYYAHGVQCSVFYGEESFFIPVHQALKVDDLDYFYEVLKSFIK